MSADPPPEIEGFHKRTMLLALPAFGIAAVAGVWAALREESIQEPDAVQEILKWVFFGGWLIFITTLIFRGLVARPRCPECGSKLSRRKTIWFRRRWPWRVLECESCDLRFRIPGFKFGN